MLKCSAAIKGGYQEELDKILQRTKFKKSLNRLGYNKKKLPQKAKYLKNKVSFGKDSGGKCLMCLQSFHGSELVRHLWECEAKLPCLNRIIEIKVEIKDEPTND